MSELTKEYFESHLEQVLDKRFDQFEQKFDQKLDAQTKDLKQFAEEQTETLARIIQKSVVEPFEKRFNEVDSKFDKLEQNLHIKL